jgi:hypothetical protein
MRAMDPLVLCPLTPRVREDCSVRNWRIRRAPTALGLVFVPRTRGARPGGAVALCVRLAPPVWA